MPWRRATSPVAQELRVHAALPRQPLLGQRKGAVVDRGDVHPSEFEIYGPWCGNRLPEHASTIPLPPLDVCGASFETKMSSNAFGFV
jgi:hypothetical protein